MQAIRVEELRKEFGKVKAVDGVSFEVEEGEVFGFLGPNGAGKTTTIRCMMDFIRPTNGTITILGKDAQKKGVALKEQIGYLSGYVRLVDKWTGRDHINYCSALDGNKNSANALAERLEFDPTIKTKKLSSGNRQKMGLILALMGEPKVLIFDEPTNALDPLLQNTVYELLKEAQQRGTTVFMSSHNLAEVEKVCTRVGIIRKGKMVATESISSLKQKRLYSVRIAFSASVKWSELAADGVEVVEQLTNGFLLNVKGEISPLLKKVEQLPLADIEITHGNLEDIFLEHYT